MVRKILNVIYSFVQTLTFSLAIFVVLYTFVLVPTEVLGSSSYPTLKEREKIINSKVSYGFEDPKRGDFVVIKSPYSNDVEFVKRIIGLPNEEILINSGNVYINKQLLDEIYLDNSIKTFGGSFLPDGKELDIPKNYYFVMGDNRSHSSDSRTFGPISRQSIIGKVIFRFWPPDRISNFD